MRARLGAMLHADVVRHGAIVFASSMLINVFGYAYHFAISRRVGVVPYGELSAINAALMIGAVLPQIVSAVLLKYAAELRAAVDTARLARLVNWVVRLAALGTVALLAALLPLGSPLARALNVGDVGAVLCAVGIFAFNSMAGSLRGLFLGVEDFTAFAVSSVVEALVKVTLGVALVYAGYGLVGAFGGWAIGSLTSLLLTGGVLTWRNRGIAQRPLGVDWRHVMRTVGGVGIALGLFTTMNYADVILVKRLADPTTAGLYGALGLSGRILFFLVGFIPLVLLPKATSRAQAGTNPAGVLGTALAALALLSGAGLVFYYFFPAKVITTLAGAAFAPAAPYVFAYGSAMTLLAVLNLIVNYKIGIHRFDFIVPLGIALVAEVAGISLYHAGLSQVITVLIAVNGATVLASAWRIWAKVEKSGGFAAEIAPAEVLPEL